MTLLAQARAAGLVVRLCGARFRVGGLEQLPPDKAEGWRTLFRSRREDVFAELGGRDDPAGPILRQLGVTVVYSADAETAAALIAEMIADAGDSPIGIDLETMPIASEQERADRMARERDEATGRAKALRRLGKVAEARAAQQAATIARLGREQAEDAGLDPHRSQIRLLQIYGGGSRAAVLDMAWLPWAVTSPLWDRSLVAHNAVFELKHLAARGIEPVSIECTMQAAGLMLGVHRRSLKDAAFHYLGLELSKELQGSDWSAPQLSPPQIHYAGLDAVLPFRLGSKLFPALRERRPAYAIQRDVLPAVARMELRGVGFDIEANRDLITTLTAERGERAQAFPKACEDIGRPDLGRELPEKPDDQRRLLEALLSHEERASWPLTPKRIGLSLRRSDLRRAAHYGPIELLTRISAIDKALTSANRLAAHISPVTGRLHADYNVAGALSGRARCSSPSLQNVPRDPRFLSEWRRRHAELCRSQRSIRIGAEVTKGVGRVYEFSWNSDPAKRQFNYPQACNLPIQGACADAAMLALTMVDARLRLAGIAGGPVLVVHDEIVVEVPEADAPEAAALLQQAMTEAFAATFPGAPLNQLVKVGTGRTWCEAKDDEPAMKVCVGTNDGSQRVSEAVPPNSTRVRQKSRAEGVS